MVELFFRIEQTQDLLFGPIRQLHQPLRGNHKQPPHPVALAFLSACFSIAGVGNGFTLKHPCRVNRANSRNASLPFMDHGSTVYDGMRGIDPPSQFFPSSESNFQRLFTKLPTTYDSSVKYFLPIDSDPVSMMSPLLQEIHDNVRIVRLVALNLSAPVITYHTLLSNPDVAESMSRVQFGKGSSIEALCNAVHSKYGANWRQHVQSQLPTADELPKARKRRKKYDPLLLILLIGALLLCRASDLPDPVGNPSNATAHRFFSRFLDLTHFRAVKTQSKKTKNSTAPAPVAGGLSQVSGRQRGVVVEFFRGCIGFNRPVRLMISVILMIFLHSLE